MSRRSPAACGDSCAGILRPAPGMRRACAPHCESKQAPRAQFYAVLCEAIAARPADPPKDTASLLELMLEIVLGHRIGLPAATREALESLQVGGKGKSLRRQLLAQPAN